MKCQPTRHRDLSLGPLCAVGLIGLCLSMGLVPEAGAVQLAAGRAAPLAAESPRATTKPAALPGPGNDGRTLELVHGTVVSVDVPRTTLVLAGQAVHWHPTQLKVFHAVTGEIGHVTQLRRGMSVRFALEPGAAPERRIVLLYLEAQP